jgi:hypothetical protein
MMWARCILTVRSLMPKTAAICLLSKPATKGEHFALARGETLQALLDPPDDRALRSGVYISINGLLDRL